MTRLLQFLSALLVAAASSAALAHSASTAYLQIKAPSEVEFEVALRDLDVLLDLDANADGKLTWGEVADRAADIQALAARSVIVQTGGQTGEARADCALNFSAPVLVQEGDSNLVRMLASSTCTIEAIEYRLFAGIDPTHRALLRVDDQAPRVVAPAQSFAIGEAPPEGFGGFMREGFTHILGGFDHVLFLIALLLPAVVERHNGRWQARTDLRRALLQVLWIATAFTAAHSITLALAASGALRISPRVIEPLIALTVLAAALNNIKPIVTRRLAWVAFAFGLIHGFGFAEVLVPLELSRGDFAVALLAFNLGVEAGQLVVVAASFSVLALAARWRGYPRWILQVGSSAVAALALVWMIERIANVEVFAALASFTQTIVAL